MTAYEKNNLIRMLRITESLYKDLYKLYKTPLYRMQEKEVKDMIKKVEKEVVILGNSNDIYGKILVDNEECKVNINI